MEMGHKMETKMIKVYHQVEPTFRASKTGVVNDDLHLVAEVATDNLNEAYQLTNTIDNSWWKNYGVKFLGSPEYGMKGCRSTSVGDVMELDGKFYQVDSVGFSSVQIKTDLRGYPITALARPNRRKI
jgi:hypothetical protein